MDDTVNAAEGRQGFVSDFLPKGRITGVTRNGEDGDTLGSQCLSGCFQSGQVMAAVNDNLPSMASKIIGSSISDTTGAAGNDYGFHDLRFLSV